METKGNYKYFTAPLLSVPAIVGLAMLAASIILIIVSSSLKVFGVLGIMVSLFVVMFGFSGKSSETDIDFQGFQRIKDLREDSMKKNEVYENHFLKGIKPFDVAGYDFEAKEDDLLSKKGGDGKARTNYFAGYSLIFGLEKIYIHGRRICLTDESKDDTTNVAVKYNELKECFIEMKNFTLPDGSSYEYCLFSISRLDGTKAIEACVNYGADTDLAVENINRAIKSRTEELEKIAAEKSAKLAAFRAKVMAEGK